MPALWLSAALYCQNVGSLEWRSALQPCRANCCKTHRPHFKRGMRPTEVLRRSRDISRLPYTVRYHRASHDLPSAKHQFCVADRIFAVTSFLSGHIEVEPFPLLY